MATPEQALAALFVFADDEAGGEGDRQLDRDDYERAARVLEVPPGQLYLTATGLPADGGDTYVEEELSRPGVLAGSSQHLVYGHLSAENPTARRHVHEWLQARARGDLQMQAAAALRDATPGEVVEPQETDVATVLTRDHDQVVALFEQLKAIPGVTSGGQEVHLSRRESIVDMITIALSRHESAEEEHFWPAVRSALPDGDELAEQALGQEREGKDLLTELGRVPASHERFDELVEEVEKASRRHVAFEDRILLALHTAMSREDRDRLGERIRDAERRGKAEHEPEIGQQALETGSGPGDGRDAGDDEQ